MSKVGRNYFRSGLLAIVLCGVPHASGIEKNITGSSTTGASLNPTTHRTAPLNPQDPPTPIRQPLPADSNLRITCEYRGTGPETNFTGVYHYQLWLPAGFDAQSAATWKVIFIASPQGHANLGNMAAWIAAHRYVAVGLEESKNGPAEPVIGNFLAAHDDICRRLHVAEGQKICTGFSGGARASSTFVTLRPGFRALILQGAGCALNLPDGTYDIKNINTPQVSVTMGTQDGNANEITRLRRSFGPRLQVFEFNGGHQWAPTESIEAALERTLK